MIVLIINKTKNESIKVFKNFQTKVKYNYYQRKKIILTSVIPKMNLNVWSYILKII